MKCQKVFFLQHFEIVRKPSTTYSFSLPTGKPLSPVKPICGPVTNQHIINASLGESDILEIPVQNSGNKMELAINSVLTFTNKCVNDSLKSDQIVKL